MDPEELGNRGLIVYWGINAFWTNLHSFALAKRHNIEIWTPDVVRIETAKLSDRFFQIKPDTDVLFAPGVARVIIKEELYDKAFVRENIYGFEEFRNYVKTLSLDYLSQEEGCGRWGDRDLREGIRRREGGVIHIGHGFQRSLAGGEAVRAITLLPALVGHYFGFIHDMKTIDKSYAEGTSLRTKPAKRIPQMRLAEYIERGEIKFLYVYNSNPLASLPNQSRLRRALRESDVFVVTYDIFLTDTALYSDVVLPANTFFERFDIVDSYYYRYVALNEGVGDTKRKNRVLLSAGSSEGFKSLPEVSEVYGQVSTQAPHPNLWHDDNKPVPQHLPHGWPLASTSTPPTQERGIEEGVLWRCLTITEE